MLAGGGFSAPAIQVEINRGRCHPQRKPVRRVARPEDSRAQATVLGNQSTLASRANTARHVSECADVKTCAELGKGVHRGRDCMSSLPVFRTQSQRGLCIYTYRVSSESPRMRGVGGGHTSENIGVKTCAYIHT